MRFRTLGPDDPSDLGGGPFGRRVSEIQAKLAKIGAEIVALQGLEARLVGLEKKHDDDVARIAKITSELTAEVGELQGLLEETSRVSEKPFRTKEA